MAAPKEKVQQVEEKRPPTDRILFIESDHPAAIPGMGRLWVPGEPSPRPHPVNCGQAFLCAQEHGYPLENSDA